MAGSSQSGANPYRDAFEQSAVQRVSDKDTPWRMRRFTDEEQYKQLADGHWVVNTP